MKKLFSRSTLVLLTLLSTAADEVLGAEGADQPALHSVKDRTKADAVRVRLLEAMVALTRVIHE